MRKVSITISPQVRSHRISKYIYGHFAEHLGRCIYGGIWVGKNSKIENDDGIRLDTVHALKQVRLPALRWPGGCFADNYHWMDGIGPRSNRPLRHNLWWNQPETNHFGTDEFMRLCAMIETEPYICLNVGSGTPHEARAWVEYCNSSQETELTRKRAENGHPAPYGVTFWGIGNENWGCGGTMRPEYYADLYRRFGTYLRRMTGPDVRLIACGSNPRLTDWDERFLDAMKDATRLVDYIAIHHYSGRGISDLNYSENDYYKLLSSIRAKERHILHACSLARAYSAYGHSIGVILDEWGTWFKEATVESGLYQQSTMQDALFAAASFHLFHRYADSLFMANMAQTVNVLQALVLTRGPKMLVTPTWHVYELFMPHRDGLFVHCNVDCGDFALPQTAEHPAVSASATVSGDGYTLFVSLLNLHVSEEVEVKLKLIGAQKQLETMRRLTADDIHAHNTFDKPQRVQPITLHAASGEGLTLPSKSITTLAFRLS